VLSYIVQPALFCRVEVPGSFSHSRWPERDGPRPSTVAAHTRREAGILFCIDRAARHVLVPEVFMSGGTRARSDTA